ncbi:MAG: xanthine dehydrogenase family protein molybdopterin-binding subunit [Actinobacteria bacterium]|nr:xanthine dehydrogenase family protein molybdopterin-binding subunit [Actinomycetota bacterium]
MSITQERETTVIGQRLLRREDPALLTGEAKYTNDLVIPGALHLAVLRSPYAHARIKSIDVSDAASMPGVVAVYTGRDLHPVWAAPMPCAWPVTTDMKNPAHFPLAIDKACYVGDGVAAVLATSESASRDALDAIDVVYEPLRAVIDLEDALSDKTIIHESLGTNKSYTWPLKVEAKEGAIDEAFKNAAFTVSERYVQQRLLPMAMEPRAVAAVPQPFGGDITLYSATQVPHILKVMTAITLGIPEHQVRVVAPAVGGGFGSKLNVYAEELLCVALARKHGAPVRWVEERTENTQATIHGRGQIQHIELAADANGKLTAIRVRLIGDMGAYLQLVTPGVPILGAFLYAGVYDLPQAYDFACTSVFTNMTPTDAYRGAGRPEATYAIEVAMDALARKMKIDPFELRKRNYIKKEQFFDANGVQVGYTAFHGLNYDSGDHLTAAQKAAKIADYDGVRKQQAKQNVAGATKRIGIGMTSYFEMCGLAPSRVLASLNYGAGGWESATVRVLPTSKVQVVTGTSPKVDVLKYVAVDDCGNQINPLIVEGQVHGGVVQGLAQALYEEAVYDSDGNLKTSNLAEYLVPAACDVPPITTDFTVTPSTTNQLGVKGIGEAGTIGAAPTVMNAVIDALSGLGITQLDMPASPNNVWNAINKARGGKQ